MKRRPLVYIAGPYTNPDPVENTRIAGVCWHRLWASGVVAPICPHLSMYLDRLCGLPYEDWMSYDFEVMVRCDAVLRLPGESIGADRETDLAESMGIPVFRDEPDLITWAGAIVRMYEARSGAMK